MGMTTDMAGLTNRHHGTLPTRARARVWCVASAWGLFLVALCVPAAPLPAKALLVETEGSGIITKTTPAATNANGAMVWNGQQWIVNNTWAHKFFVDDLGTGDRLKPHNVQIVNSSGTFMNYQVTRSSYQYTTGRRGGGRFRYGAVEYLILDMVTGKSVLLRSRGSGNGTAQPYFNIYIEDDVTSGVQQQTTALRGDPVWYTYVATTAQEAAQITDAQSGRTGEMPAATDTGLVPCSAVSGCRTGYFLDVNNGSDMGGKSYHFHTESITSGVEDLGSSFPVDCDIEWMDAQGDLQELRFFPEVIGEGVFFDTRAAPALGTGASLLTVALLACYGMWRLRRGRIGGTRSETTAYLASAGVSSGT